MTKRNKKEKLSPETITIIGIIQNDCITGIRYGEIQIEVSPFTPASPIPPQETRVQRAYQKTRNAQLARIRRNNTHNK